MKQIIGQSHGTFLALMLLCKSVIINYLTIVAVPLSKMHLLLHRIFTFLNPQYKSLHLIMAADLQPLQFMNHQ